MEIVVGHQGIRVVPVQRSTARTDVFEFMSSNVSTRETEERGHSRDGAEFTARERRGRKILVVAGPAVVHTGGGEHFEKLIEWGYVDLLFAGNALAAHDIENALFGTSLGVDLEHGRPRRRGHENHMRAINAIRAAGGITQRRREAVC